jgi:hypothetical protein
MAQDSRSVNDIINNAFYLIGEITPDIIPPASLIDRGLFLLNDMLDSFSALGVFIPVIKEITVTLTASQATYSISNIVPADFNFNRLVELDFVIIRQDNTDYPVRVVDRATILNGIRYPRAFTRPCYVYMDKLELQTNLTFYPVPSLAFVVNIRGKFMLDRLSMFQVITEVPPHYFKFLRYALARELTSYYPSSNWKQTQEDEYQMMLKRIKAATPVNLLISPDPILMFPWQGNYSTQFPFGLI